jgi:hypothetical protein
MVRKAKHVHRYKRDILGRGYVIYKCTLPGCTHYIAETLLINRIALCGKCNEPFVIGKFEAKMAIPRCENCVKSSPDEDLTELDKAINERI